MITDRCCIALFSGLGQANCLSQAGLFCFFHNPQKSNMDCRIFNLRIPSVLHAHTNGEGQLKDCVAYAKEALCFVRGRFVKSCPLVNEPRHAADDRCPAVPDPRNITPQHQTARTIDKLCGLAGRSSRQLKRAQHHCVTQRQRLMKSSVLKYCRIEVSHQIGTRHLQTVRYLRLDPLCRCTFIDRRHAARFLWELLWDMSLLWRLCPLQSMFYVASHRGHIRHTHTHKNHILVYYTKLPKGL